LRFAVRDRTEPLSEIAYLDLGTRMPVKPADYRVSVGTQVNLKKWPTAARPAYRTDRRYRDILSTQAEELGRLQSLLYASGRYALLMIFQGMDASGKDGAIAHVMSGINPQGCRVFSFKQPSAEELKHDFLWRTIRELPERGLIGIFNRSYYEEVLIVRVHPEILRAEGLPHELLDETRIWRDRYRSIVEMERHLERNGTRIIKFFLHVSQDEQRKRLLERIETPEKNWKISSADIAERQYWKQYMKAYEKCLSATSTAHAPWYIVPADDKLNARLIISRIVLDNIEALRLRYPKSSSGRRRELRSMRKQLEE
jgi:PPK2 family polyphosphate:nucleotide phosphotransferase